MYRNNTAVGYAFAQKLPELHLSLITLSCSSMYPGFVYTACNYTSLSTLRVTTLCSLHAHCILPINTPLYINPECVGFIKSTRLFRCGSGLVATCPHPKSTAPPPPRICVRTSLRAVQETKYLHPVVYVLHLRTDTSS